MGEVTSSESNVKSLADKVDDMKEEYANKIEENEKI